MLILKPLTVDRSRSIVQKSNLVLSFRAQVCHPNTCACPRLLGPCFKTGRKKPFRQHPGTKYKPSWRLVAQALKSLKQFHRQSTTMDLARIPEPSQRSHLHPAQPRREAWSEVILPQSELMLTPSCKQHSDAKPKAILQQETGFIRLHLSDFRHF